MANTRKRVSETVSEENNTITPEKEITKPEQDKSNLVAKEVDSSQYITVRNGFQGKLVYTSSRTGEVFVWDGFGSEQEMELRELRNAKNNNKKFFQNNWFMFDDIWVVDYLGVKQYYKNALSIDNFDEIFSLPSSELASVISKLSEGQKKSVAYRAMELIREEAIDSRKTITTLEELLGIELIEK